MATHVLEDVALHYELTGHGPPLVLINALTMEASGWRSQTKAFASRYRVLTYDCRGQGRSAKPDQDYRIEQHADDLHRLVIGLGLPRLHVVGLSLGAMVAQAFALKYPAQTGALVLCSAVSHLSAELQQFLTTWVRTLGEAGGAQAFHGAEPLLFSRGYADTHPGVVKGLRAAVDRQPVGALRHLALGAMNHDLEGRLDSIRTPTLVVVGEEDRLTPIRDARRLVDLIPGATLKVLPACGHVCPLERPVVFNDAVLQFVRSHDALLGLKMVAPGGHPSGASRLKS